MEKYLPEHREFVLKLLKAGGAGSSEKQRIFELYKLYIDPNHLTWTDTSCNSCSSSILMMWSKLKDYVLNNSTLFEPKNDTKNEKK